MPPTLWFVPTAKICRRGPRNHLTCPQGAFLPFHRLMMYTHEVALRDECGYKGYQPYVSSGAVPSDTANLNTAYLGTGTSRKTRASSPRQRFLTPPMASAATVPRVPDASRTAPLPTTPIRSARATRSPITASTGASTTPSAPARRRAR